MTQANYKSTRLLIEATNRAMDEVRKAAMGNIALPWTALNELRNLVEQLAEKANRTALEDVSIQNMTPGDYVATMKPLVATFHRQTMAANMLAPCLCEDLQALACVLILVGEGKTVVRASHVSDRPEIALAVETIVASIDAGTKQVVSEAEAAMSALEAPVGPPENAAIEEISELAGVALCSGCDCVAGDCDCEGCEGRTQ